MCMWTDRKSTRLNSSHRCISYAVFCLKKKLILKIEPRIGAEAPAIAQLCGCMPQTPNQVRSLWVFPETCDWRAPTAFWSSFFNSAEDALGVLTLSSMLDWND